MVFLRMRWVVFLRAVNVGGANRCQPALIAKELAKFGVVNIGAVGTFVVREDVSESVLRAAIAKKLPFKCEIMICPARDLIKLASKESIRATPLGSGHHPVRQRASQTTWRAALFLSVCPRTMTGC